MLGENKEENELTFFVRLKRERGKSESCVLFLVISDVTCIGTWREDPEMGPIYTEEETVTRVGDEAKADNQSLLAKLQAAKYPRILALRDQKGSGECLEYRKIENSLQVSLLPQCQLRRQQREPAKLRNSSSKQDQIYLQNFTLKGSCQEALRDKHAVALGVKATLPYSFLLLSSQISFIILITTVTVMWNF